MAFHSLDNKEYVGTGAEKPQSPYVGVSWIRGPKNKHKNPWRAHVRHEQVLYQLGHYPTPDEAARVRDVAALKLQGPNAQVNFDGEPPPGITKDSIYEQIDAQRKAKGLDPLTHNSA